MNASDSRIQPEQLTLPLRSAVSAEEVYVRAFRRLGLRRPVPAFDVEFRPFTALRSTIRLKATYVQVRISDLLREAPPLVQDALAEILIAKAFRRRASREARECYVAYVFSDVMRRRIDEARRSRGRKRLLPPRGRWYDLEEVFRRLNRRFFAGELPTPRLGWSLRRSRTVLGHYDPAHASITISRWLDSPTIPPCLVDYLMFHEMLHMRFPVARNGHRRVVHSREFREAERNFPDFERARRVLKQQHLQLNAGL